MGTRATYQFETKGKYGINKKVTYYIHWDGYPAGAATYFKAAADLLAAHPRTEPGDDWRGNIAEAFVRANLLAEITPDHEAHGDTEYRYDVVTEYGAETTVKAYKREFTADDMTNWTVIFEGELKEFLTKYLEKEAA